MKISFVKINGKQLQFYNNNSYFLYTVTVCSLQSVHGGLGKGPLFWDSEVHNTDN